MGEQTRSHKDLDIIIGDLDVTKLRELLTAIGFVEQPDGRDVNFVLADSDGHEVDVHVVTFDQDGYGLYKMANGDTWEFPSKGLKSWGCIADCDVRCLSAEVQVQCHAHGYEPTEKDIRDMELLRERFGVTLPSKLRNNSS